LVCTPQKKTARPCRSTSGTRCQRRRRR
jgi:hypothetical protein